MPVRFLATSCISDMHIVLNGEQKVLTGPVTVTELLQQLGVGNRRVAVEINHEIVPRSRHAEHRLQPGDRVEVVYAVGGG